MPEHIARTWSLCPAWPGSLRLDVGCLGQDHRRGWIADCIKKLTIVFAIDIAAYAVMSAFYLMRVLPFNLSSFILDLNYT